MRPSIQPPSDTRHPRGKPVDAALEFLTAVAKGGAIAFVALWIGLGVRFLVEVLLARFLGAHDYGVFSLTLSILVILGQAATLGLPQGVLRFGAQYHGAKDHQRVKDTAVTAFLVGVTVSVMCALVVFAAADSLAARFFSDGGTSRVIRIMVWALPFTAILTTSFFAARAIQAIKTFATLKDLLLPIATLVIFAVLLFMGQGLQEIAAGYVVAAAFAGLVSLLVLRKVYPQAFDGSLLPGRFRAHWRFTLAVWLTDLLWTFRTYIVLPILGMFAPASDVGIFTAALKVAALLTVVLSSLNAILAPITADLYHRDRMADLNRVVSSVTCWSTLLTIPGVVVIVILSEPIMRLFGQEFGDGASVLVLMAISRLVSALVGPVGVVLQMSGRQHIELANAVFQSVAIVLLSFFIVPHHGIIGAALVVSVIAAVVDVVRLAEVWGLAKVNPLAWEGKGRLLLAVATSGVLAGIFAIGMPGGTYNPWIAAAVFALVYGSILYMQGLGDTMVFKLATSKVSKLGDNFSEQAPGSTFNGTN